MKCNVCGMNFDEERRLKIHMKTHENKKPKNKLKGTMDFEAPRFDQVM